ncbi:hypothetical protein DV735_g1852, partial [Chaetothyriales sp. CBS 134920]
MSVPRDSYLKKQPLVPADADVEKLAAKCEQKVARPAWGVGWLHSANKLERSAVQQLFRSAISLLRLLTTPAVLLFLVPSFILSPFDRSLRSKKPAKRNHLAALDGLRGLACLMVMHMHWSFAVTDSNKNGSPETNSKYLFHRPFFYLFWAGTSHVNIFFVMSGYVLSVKCLHMLHQHQGSQAYDVLASSILRRACRIFLPPIALLFIFLVAIRMHVFDRADAIFKENREHRIYQLALFETVPPILPTFYDQLRDVLGAAYNLMDPSPHQYFPVSSYAPYDTHLWTIPTEFYCSMALFVVLVATSRIRTECRLYVHFFLVAFCWLVNHQQHGLFFAGMTIAELDVMLKLRQDNALKRRPDSAPKSSATLSEALPGALSSYLRRSNMVRAGGFTFGCYLLSLPLVWAENTPAFMPVINAMPEYMQVGHRQDALRALGAVLVVWSITYTVTVDNARPSYFIRAVFENPVSRYLGQISFSFYLIHGFVIRSLGYTILPSLYTFVIPDPQRRKALAGRHDANLGWVDSDVAITSVEVAAIWILGYLIVLPACIWMSDIFWRAVDVKSMSLSRWIDEKMLPPREDHSSEKLNSRAAAKMS